MTAKATHAAKPAHRPVRAKNGGKPETPTRFAADLKHIFDQAVKYAMTDDPERPEGATTTDAKQAAVDFATGWMSDYLGTDAKLDLPASGLDGLGGDDDDDAIEDAVD